MKWMELPKEELFDLLSTATMVQLQNITGYQKGLIGQKKYPQPRKTKMDLVKLLTKLIHDNDYKTKFYNELCATPESKELYHTLIWKQKEIGTQEAIEKFGLDLAKTVRVGYDDEKLMGNLSLIHKNSRWRNESLYIYDRIRPILKLICPVPDDYTPRAAESIEEADYTYSNEDNVFETISTLEEMLKTNLVKFGKTGEKPLAKTLNILKSSTYQNEFYPDKKMDTLSIDMLTRSFSFYYWENHKFKTEPVETLRTFVNLQLNDRFNYAISRVFLSHMRKVKFGKYSDGQMELFNITQILVDTMPKDDWVECDALINYCNYRDYRIDLESHYATERYYMDVDAKKERYGDDKIYAEDDYYNALVLEPMIRGMFFYLGALGIVELKYNAPVSSHAIKAKGKPYISLWDGLKYIKLTSLGRYIFDYAESYTPRKRVSKTSSVKFDEYKPIITIDSKDTIMFAKLEPYSEKLDKSRVILTYSKIFQNCKSRKILEMKIDKFYTLFDEPVPHLFDLYFDEILEKSGLLTRDLNQIVIELKNDKQLLNLFMTNKKLQDLVIKASGYRVIVSKNDMPKLTKIVKENGFFVEF